MAEHGADQGADERESAGTLGLRSGQAGSARGSSPRTNCSFARSRHSDLAAMTAMPSTCCSSAPQDDRLARPHEEELASELEACTRSRERAAGRRGRLPDADEDAATDRRGEGPGTPCGGRARRRGTAEAEQAERLRLAAQIGARCGPGSKRRRFSRGARRAGAAAGDLETAKQTRRALPPRRSGSGSMRRSPAGGRNGRSRVKEALARLDAADHAVPSCGQRWRSLRTGRRSSELRTDRPGRRARANEPAEREDDPLSPTRVADAEPASRGRRLRAALRHAPTRSYCTAARPQLLASSRGADRRSVRGPLSRPTTTERGERSTTRGTRSSTLSRAQNGMSSSSPARRMLSALDPAADPLLAESRRRRPAAPPRSPRRRARRRAPRRSGRRRRRRRSRSAPSTPGAENRDLVGVAAPPRPRRRG